MNTFVDRVKQALSRVSGGGKMSYEDVDIAWESRTYRMRGYRNDHIIRELKSSGTFYENQLLAEVLRRYGKGGLYVDVGGFIGNHAIFFAKECAADAVVTVEPFKPSYELLLHNIKTNNASNVKAFNVALGAANASGRLASPTKNLGMNTIVSESEGDVKIMLADDLITSPPKLIKIDTEGWAMHVLKGMQKTLREHHPVLAIETQPDPVEPFQEFLSAFGYKLAGQFNYTPTYLFE